MSKEKSEITALVIYKLFVNFLRISLSIIILSFGLNLDRITRFFFGSHIIYNPDHKIINYLVELVHFPSRTLTLILALSVLTISVIELLFVFGLALRRRWAAVGLLVIAILWIPVELLFISKFLTVSKLISLVIDFIIIFFLARLLVNSHGYFKTGKALK